MLQASDLTKAYDGAPLFDGLSFVLADGERAGLVGSNGVGKSTLLRLLAGVDRPDRGAAATGSGERIGWLAQEAPDAATTLGELLGAVWTVRDELRGLLARMAAGDTSHDTVERYGQAQARFEALGGWALEASLEADIATTRRQAQHTELTVSRAAAPKLKRYAKKVAKKAKAREGRLRRELEGDRAVQLPAQRPVPRLRLDAPGRGRRRVAAHRPLGRLSPGERARVHMAAMVASGAELLLLDEPTNHLDPETLEAVETALRAFGGTIVAVSPTTARSSTGSG
jgi:ATPase subunit of ABC transporter with duplicated ATPase domains